jgi:hypothetical protein
MLRNSHPLPRLNLRVGVCALLLFVLSLRLPAIATEHSSEKILRLVQMHYFLGANELDIAKEAIRIENKGRFRFILVSKAPTWEVTIFRNDDRVYFSESLAKFEAGGVISDLITPTKNRHIGGKRPPYDFHFDTLAARRRVGPGQSIEYLPLKNITSPQVEAVIYATYKIPTEEGIPLHVIDTNMGKDWLTGIDETGHRKIHLKTTAAEFVKIPKGSFVIPNGYRRVATVQEAVSGATARKESEAFEPMFDVGKKGTR